MPTRVLKDLLATLPDGEVQDIRVGIHWTAVAVIVGGDRRCGLASTLRGEDLHHHGGEPAVRDAGHLTKRGARELAGLVLSRSPTETAIGMATINALLPRQPDRWEEINAEEVIAQRGAGRRVALIGHFPFVPRLRGRVGTLWVLEQRPREGDLAAEAAPEIIPQADVLAVTGTTLINHTFEELMALRRPGALVLLLGPTTPLSPTLFEYGVHILSGAVVENVDAVLHAVSQGANFRQVRRQGVRLVTMQRRPSEKISPSTHETKRRDEASNVR